MIKVRNLVKVYETSDNKVEALNGIDLDVLKGEIFGVIGLSGAGKSSLVRCISSIEKPTKGEIFINGVDISKLSGKDLRESRKKIGMVFQHFNLYMNRTVFENIAFPLEISNVDKGVIKKRVHELLEIVGLSDKKDVYPHMLSGGQKQRVGIARALAPNPDILICDEATSALDPVTTKSILDLIKEINNKLDITVLVITHEMNVIKEICNKVAILESGKIIEEGSVIDIFVSPKTNTAKTFFGDPNLKLSNHAYRKVLEKHRTLYKINFIGDNSVDAYISSAIKKFNIDIAILAGNIQEINDTLIGSLVIDIDSKEDIGEVIEYFKNQNLIVEEFLENVG